MKSYLLEVLATNCFHRQHMLLNTTQDMVKMGLRPESVRSVACFPKPVLKGFYLITVPPTKGEIPGQQEIIKAYQRYPALFNLRHHPIIGEIQEGVYAGQRIALFSQEEIRQYFSYDAVRLAVKRETPYLNTRWRVAKNHAEAQPYYCRNDLETILGVMRTQFHYGSLTLTAHDHHIFRVQVKSVGERLRGWLAEHGRDMSHFSMLKLADIYICLTKTIRSEEHYLALRDVLWALNGCLLHGRGLTERTITTQIKTLIHIDKVFK